MRISQRLPALGVLVFALGALAILSAPIASLTPAIAQQQSTNTTSPEAPPEGEAATTEEHAHEATSNESATHTSTVRDSLVVLLTDQTIPSNDFLHLYDTTPYSIRNGHVAAKIPCDDESAPLLNILVGVAPDLAPAPLELVPPLSTPGELCLYHADLPTPAQANATTTANATAANATAMITDIAIQNPGDEDVTLPSTSTVVIGVNEIEQGAHSHEEEG
jgi:cytoskeletal protein RodZ